MSDARSMDEIWDLVAAEAAASDERLSSAEMYEADGVTYSLTYEREVARHAAVRWAAAKVNSASDRASASARVLALMSGPMADAGPIEDAGPHDAALREGWTEGCQAVWEIVEGGAS